MPRETLPDPQTLQIRRNSAHDITLTAFQDIEKAKLQENVSDRYLLPGVRPFHQDQVQAL